MSLLSC